MAYTVPGFRRKLYYKEGYMECVEQVANLKRQLAMSDSDEALELRAENERLRAL